jgi:hypothetical protein
MSTAQGVWARAGVRRATMHCMHAIDSKNLKMSKKKRRKSTFSNKKLFQVCQAETECMVWQPSFVARGSLRGTPRFLLSVCWPIALRIYLSLPDRPSRTPKLLPAVTLWVVCFARTANIFSNVDATGARTPHLSFRSPPESPL